MQVKYVQGRFNNRRILNREDLERMMPGDDVPELPDQLDWNAAQDHILEVNDEIAEALLKALPNEFAEYVEPEPVVETVDEQPTAKVEKVDDGTSKPSSKKKKSDPETEDD